MVVGVHARNESNLLISDKSALNRLQGAAIVFWYQNPDNLIQCGVVPQNSIVRLQDSVYKDVNGKDYIPSYVTYATDVVATIKKFYAYGFRRFVLDNEPNLTWPTLKKADGTSFGVWDWSLFMLYAMVDNIVGIRRNIPNDSELIFTPISQPLQNTSWITVSQSRGLLQLFNAVSAHCYWQASGDEFNPIFGANFQWLHMKTGKNVYITEVANSKIQSQHPLPLETIRQLQAQQYPGYVKFVNESSYVKGVYFYMLGGTQQWEGFWLTPPIVDAIVNVTNSLPYNLGNGIYAM